MQHACLGMCGISQAGSAHLHCIPHTHGRINSLILLQSFLDNGDGRLTEGLLIVPQQRVCQVGIKGGRLADGVQLIPAGTGVVLGATWKIILLSVLGEVTQRLCTISVPQSMCTAI